MKEKEIKRAIKRVQSVSASENGVFPDYERTALIKHIAKERVISMETASRYVENCLKSRSSKGVYLILQVVLMIGVFIYLMNVGGYATKKNIYVLIGTLVLLSAIVYYPLSFRARKAKLIWKERTTSTDGTKNAIEEIFKLYQHGRVYYLGISGIFYICFLSAALAFCFVNMFDMDISVTQLMSGIDKIDSVKDINRIERWLMNKETAKIEHLLKEAYLNAEGDVDKCYRIAMVTYRLDKKGIVSPDILSDFSNNLICDLTVTQLDNEYEMEAFIPILASANEDEFTAFLDRLSTRNLFEDLSMSKLKKLFNVVEEKLNLGTRDAYIFAVLLNKMQSSGYIDRTFALNLIEKNIVELNLNDINTDVMALEMLSIFEVLSSKSKEIIVEKMTDINMPNVYYLWFLADYYKANNDILKIMEAYDKFDKGYNDVFLNRVCLGDTIAITQKYLKSVGNLEHQKAIIKSSAANQKEINEVLAYIHLAAEYGLKPLECFAKKVVVEYDTTHLDAFADQTGKYRSGSKLIVIYRTEIEETLEFRDCSPNQFSWDINDIDLFGKEYESNNSIGEKAYIIQLDIESMNNLPISKIPPSVDECDFILVLDAQYVRSGSIIRTKYEYKYDSLQFENSKRIIHAQKQYPTYESIQFIDVYNAHSSELYYRFAYNIVESELQLTDLDKYDYDSEKEMEQYYISIHDLNWIEDEKNEALNLLKKNDWNINLAIIGAKSKNKN